MAKFLTGVVAGIAIGLLIAPDKGSNTRRRISEGLNEFLGEAQDTMDAASQKLGGVANDYDSDMERPIAKISSDF